MKCFNEIIGLMPHRKQNRTREVTVHMKQTKTKKRQARIMIGNELAKFCVNCYRFDVYLWLEV